MFIEFCPNNAHKVPFTLSKFIPKSVKIPKKQLSRMQEMSESILYWQQNVLVSANR